MTTIWLILLAIAYLSMALYSAMILFAISGWQKLRSEPVNDQHIGVSVLVAARNEAENIEAILSDLLKQDYPPDLFEVIVIDDGSDDDTLQKCTRLKETHLTLKVLSNKNGEGKKAALKTGIEQASYSLIAAVDADCRVSNQWLKTMVSQWKSESTKMLLGPVVLAPSPTLFQQIQSQEMLATMGLTGGAAAYGKPVMANGANIMFDKEAFNEIGGYENNGNPSGDDVFTMLKMDEKWPGSIDFTKDFRAIVQTSPQENFSEFWQQRKRWLSKKSGYSNKWVRASAWITYAANVTGLAALLTVMFNFGSSYMDELLWLLFIKTIMDLMIIRTVRKDLQPDCSMWNIIPAEIFIVTYVSIIGLIGNAKKYTWKGRSVKVNG